MADADDLLSRENVERIRSAYEAVTRGDLESIMIELVDPDIVLRDRPEAPDPRTYRGREGVLEALASSDESFEEFNLVPQELEAVGDQVVVTLRMFGRGRGSGVPVEETIAHLWTMREGKAVAMQVYSDPEDALRDARRRSAAQA
jgi:ketosteroid isomerase-like protein